jgi:5-oxopent-3-ene-1,2,5-tricarboxylate decarboxylase/2-hydroxyhepta-2,4-diene-1,7-dioate isomerase
VSANATAYQKSQPYPIRLAVDPQGNAEPTLDWDVPVHGMVVGVLLNSPASLAAMGAALHDVPYKAPPRAPVLYIKPANTVIADGTPIPLPAEVEEVEIGATLGLVIGRQATRVAASEALDFVQGYVVVNDVCEAHESVYRPAIRQRSRDGFCPVGRWVMDRDQVPNPDALEVNVYLNGHLAARSSTAGLVRNAAQLLADVTEFMTLMPGDVLLLGNLSNNLGPLPRARAGDLVSVEIPGVGMLANLLVREGARA